MSNWWEVLGFAGVIVTGPLILTIAVAALVRRQNARVLANDADEQLQAMLQAGKLLNELAKDESVPAPERARAEQLARIYPRADQLAVFAEALANDLRRNAKAPPCESDQYRL